MKKDLRIILDHGKEHLGSTALLSDYMLLLHNLCCIKEGGLNRFVSHLNRF